MRNGVHPHFWMLVTALVLSASAEPAAAQQAYSFQQRSSVVVGYVASAPDQLLGFSAMTVGPMWRGWGLAVDYKRSTDSPGDESNFEAETTVPDALDVGQEFSNESDWTTINVALVRAVSDDLALYAGGGFSERTVYRQFQRQPGLDGTPFFWVQDDEPEKDHVNVSAGGFMRIMHAFVFQIGLQTAPRGAVAGVSIALPLGS